MYIVQYADQANSDNALYLNTFLFSQNDHVAQTGADASHSAILVASYAQCVSLISTFRLRGLVVLTIFVRVYCKDFVSYLMVANIVTRRGARRVRVAQALQRVFSPCIYVRAILSAMSRLTPAFKEEFDAALAQENVLPYNEVMQECLRVLEKHNLLYTIVADPSQFLCHMKNRGGLMLSAHKAHRNAETIHMVGADRKQLTNAVAFELAPAGALRQENLEKNLALNARANGLLAAINGKERFLTVGCGHTTAFCKHAKAGGKTHIKRLSDAHGMIDLHKLFKNTELKAMIEQGWEWTVVVFEVDNTYPRFAHIAQKALNTANHVAQHTGELEAAVYLANIVHDEGFQEQNCWEELAAGQIEDLCVPCSGYARTILTFVMDYGGGEDASQIYFMDAVAKQFGCSNVLGESFWKVVTTTQFFDKTHLFPLLRVALLLVNLSAQPERVEDGIAKLLVKSDVVKLASKGKADVAADCEDTLVKAKLIANVLVKQHPKLLDETASLLPLGQMFVRVGLLATQKGNVGREETEYTLQGIKDSFLASLSAIVKVEVKYPPWHHKAEAHAKPKAAQANASSSKTTATLEDHGNPAWIAEKAGFKVGMSIVEKLDGAVSIERCFDIVSIDADKVIKLVTVCAYDGAHKTVEISLDTLLNKWQVTKMEAPVKLTVQEYTSNATDIEHKKAQIFSAICDTHSSAAANTLEFWRRPDMVRTGAKAIAAGQLTLVPRLSLANISAKNNANALSLGTYKIGGKKVEFFATHVPRPPFKADEPMKIPDDSSISAFYWIGTCSVKKDANMAIEMKDAKGIRVPVFKNICAIEPYTKLRYYVAQKVRQSTIDSIDAEGSEAKKRKSA